MFHARFLWFMQHFNRSCKISMVHAIFLWFIQHFNGSCNISIIEVRFLQWIMQHFNGSCNISIIEVSFYIRCKISTMVHARLLWFMPGCHYISFFFSLFLEAANLWLISLHKFSRNNLCGNYCPLTLTNLSLTTSHLCWMAAMPCHVREREASTVAPFPVQVEKSVVNQLVISHSIRL
jgi:hypothetical protein